MTGEARRKKYVCIFILAPIISIMKCGLFVFKFITPFDFTYFN